MPAPVEIRLAGTDQKDPGHGIPAEQRPLRPAQDFDAFHVVKVGIIAAAHIGAVHEHAHGRVGIVRVAGNDAPHAEDRPGRMPAALQFGKAGRAGEDIGHVLDARVGDFLRAVVDDACRHLADVLLHFLRVDENLGQRHEHVRTRFRGFPFRFQGVRGFGCVLLRRRGGSRKGPREQSPQDKQCECQGSKTFHHVILLLC